MRRRRALEVLAALGAAACAGVRAPIASDAPRDPESFLRSRLRARRDGALVVVTDPSRGRAASYDAALMALYLLRRARAGDAERILAGLAALQGEDGAIPFSAPIDAPPETPAYVRSGAVAWVGYAAAEFLDAGAETALRGRVLALAHRAGGYLLARRVSRAGDRRAGLVTGGAGTYAYDVEPDGAVRERLVPGEVPWASVEHNVDAFFFLRRLARVTGVARYAEAADSIREALAARGFTDDEGQLAAGFTESAVDLTPALDCASWGALFLVAAGDVARARRSRAVADAGYASREPRSGARGHRPYARGPVYENPALMRRFAPSLPAADWDALDAVWPEGSAGVALAALRTGDPDRARRILRDLEPLRAADGSLPTFTLDVPFVLDTAPSIAGTAWVELVRWELARTPAPPTFWI